MEENISSYLTNDKVNVPIENIVQVKCGTTLYDTTQIHSIERLFHSLWNDSLVGWWVAAKNFSNYKDDDKSYVKLIQSKGSIDQVKVILDSYMKVSSLKESTPCRGNSKGMRSNIVDYSMCTRLLYLAENVLDMRTAENLVTVSCNDVKANSDYSVSTGVSIPNDANSRMSQHIV